VEHAKAHGFFDVTINKAIIHEAETQMRVFAQDADWESYRQAKKFFKELGGIRQGGTVSHRLGCFFLGLRAKEQLGLKIRDIKKLLIR
jgi:hypothetical protein